MQADLPERLRANPPGWETYADVVVIGSGIAGLTAALRIREVLAASPEGGSVMVVTKDILSAGSTQWAQGGIAAALGEGDTPEQHLQDTLVAGAGVCDEAAVRVLVTQGPDAVRELIALGTNFDQTPEGELSLTREGGHHRDRIAHAGGDATGAEIQRALVSAVKAAPEIAVTEHALAVDLIPGEGGGIAGVTLHVMGEGQRGGLGAVHCRAVVLASGGLGQVFSQTTNPAVATGDGMALALRAGAVLRDLEFVQFHPTVMWLGPDSRGQQPLISEAVRGEGAFLVDWDGDRFMLGQHELADLAPRDVVAKAITRRMLEEGKPHMWLDARHLGADREGRAASEASDEFGDQAGREAAVSRFWRRRFPTILATCRRHGVDPVTELIPVAPACHYASGGVATDLDGQSTLPGLFATGEVACSGVHGANRLASNSLLEGLVFSRRIAEAIRRDGLPPRRTPAEDGRKPGLVDAAVMPRSQRIMTEKVGVLRNADGMSAAKVALGTLAVSGGATPQTESWAATNLVTVSTALANAALLREETRGSHWREDFPERDDEHWLGHVDTVLIGGELLAAYHPPPGAGGVVVIARTSYEMLPGELLAELTAAGLDPHSVYAAIAAAIAEDLPGDSADVTSDATIPPSARGVAEMAAREDGVVAGLGVAALVFAYVLGDDVAFTGRVADGTRVAAGEVVMRVSGPTRGLLTAERTALNFASHLSGIATATSRWAAALEGTGARVLDTRKTLPTFRALQKYAVRCGGGVNHRFGLSDMALVKDNHVVAAGGVVPAYDAVRAAYPDIPVEVEVSDIDELKALLEAGCERILLDNMTDEQMAEAVAVTDGRATLEASGGLTLDRARSVAATGVDFISTGALTHSVVVFDLGLDLRET